MYILAIESSCDETSISIMDNGKIINNIIASQIDIHKEYGGVVPEIASRYHVENFPFVFLEAIKNIDISKVTHVAYTNEPGLIGCLQIGYLVANAISISLNVPLIKINHILGHIYASAIDHEIKYPALALVTSGGHTQLMELSSKNKIKLLGETQDDAVGEVYDKVGRKLNLEYPAGPKIDKLASLGTANIKFPIAKTHNLDFSFSGLKSSVINYINNSKQRKEKIDVNNVCASFQKVAVQTLIEKTKLALDQKEYETVILAGGVSANSLLRTEFKKLHKNVVIPKLEYCTDNAAMIASACYHIHS